MKSKRKLLYTLILVFSFFISETVFAKSIIGISMPSDSFERWDASGKGLFDLEGGFESSKLSQRWAFDGGNMKQLLEIMGYEVILKFAGNDVKQQQSDIESMIAKGAKALIIGSVDCSKLSQVLEDAAKNKITVIAYDRLITGSANVDYYVTFDNFQVGVMQANFIIKALGLDANKGSYNMELFAGSSDDSNTQFFYNGAIKVLKPFIDNGSLKIRSGERNLNEISIAKWSSDVAESRMDKLLEKYYKGRVVEAILSPADEVSVGIIASLKKSDYGSNNQPFPYITGQDANLASVKSILKKEQGSTVFKDTRKLAKVTVDLVLTLMEGKLPSAEGMQVFNNGSKFVPSVVLPCKLVDSNNWKEVLVESGYYDESEVLSEDE